MTHEAAVFEQCLSSWANFSSFFFYSSQLTREKWFDECSDRSLRCRTRKSSSTVCDGECHSTVHWTGVLSEISVKGSDGPAMGFMAYQFKAATAQPCASWPIKFKASTANPFASGPTIVLPKSRFATRTDFFTFPISNKPTYASGLGFYNHHGK